MNRLELAFQTLNSEASTSSRETQRVPSMLSGQWRDLARLRATVMQVNGTAHLDANPTNVLGSLEVRLDLAGVCIVN